MTRSSDRRTRHLRHRKRGRNNGAAATLQPCSITPSVTSALLICASAIDVATGQTISDSFTADDFQVFSPGANYGLVVWSKVQSPAAAINPTLTMTSGTPSFSAIQAAFKPATGGGGTPSLPCWSVARALRGIYTGGPHSTPWSRAPVLAAALFDN